MIYISQCKCPKDHCLLALAWETDPRELDQVQPFMVEKLKAGLADATRRKLLNPWCGLCDSRDLQYTTHVTPWKTVEEAEPFLFASERQQLAIAGISPAHADLVRAELQDLSKNP